ncbi:MAG TPA: hypothetical protein VK540_18580 [Polyangiaceae bacterium]|nr:hypothetical protein [Polyangiaceae bacterium]
MRSSNADAEQNPSCSWERARVPTTAERNVIRVVRGERRTTPELNAVDAPRKGSGAAHAAPVPGGTENAHEKRCIQ